MKEIFQYETLEQNFSLWYAQNGRQMQMQTKSKKEFAVWQSDAYEKLKELFSYDFFEPVPMNPVLLSNRDCGSYVEKIYRLTTERDTYMPTAVLEPKKTCESAGTVLFFPGHGGGILSYLEHPDYPQLTEEIRKSRQEAWLEGNKNPKTGSIVRQLAEAGVRVVMPESRGIGLRREKRDQSWVPGRASSCSHGEIGRVAIAMGTSLAAMNLWDFSVALNFAQKGLKKGEKLIVGGHSGGGMMALYMAALHSELAGCFSSGYFYGVKESLMDMPENCICNYVPGLWKWFDMCDIAALCVPRPIFIESGSTDSLNGASGLKNVTEQVEQLKLAYGCTGNKGQVMHHVYSGGHCAGLTDGVCLEWIKKTLGC